MHRARAHTRNERTELEDLIEKTGDGGCTVHEFLTGDSDLPACVEMDRTQHSLKSLGMIRK